MKKFNFPPSIFIAFIAIFLSACAADQSTPTEIIASPPPTSVPPTEPPPALAFFVADPNSDPLLVSEIGNIVFSYSQQNALDYQALFPISEIDFSKEIELIVIFADIPDISSLASENPGIHFVILGQSPQPAPANTYFLPLPNDLQEGAAFLAGYIAAISTKDWRAGIFYTDEEGSLASAFVAGMEYFCGSCVPVRPPYVNYPFAQQAASPANWQVQAQELALQGITTVYISPRLEKLEIQQYFAGRNMLLLGSHAPPEEIVSNWLATISADIPAHFRQNLPLLLEGQAPDSNTLSLIISHVNSQQLSDARLTHLREIVADIESGFIGLPSDN